MDHFRGIGFYSYKCGLLTTFHHVIYYHHLYLSCDALWRNLFFRRIQFASILNFGQFQTALESKAAGGRRSDMVHSEALCVVKTWSIGIRAVVGGKKAIGLYLHPIMPKYTLFTNVKPKFGPAANGPQ